MSKKFDVVIGNPPYQEEAQGGGTRDTPLYHLFMDAAHEVAKKAVLITPARFLFNAGFTPKAWNERMLADRRLTVPYYVPTSGELFPGTDIKGGIAVTSWADDRDGEPIGIFTKYPELNTILHKVICSNHTSLESEVTSGRSYRYTQVMHDENPSASGLMSSDAQFQVSTNAFDRVAFLFHKDRPEDGEEYVRVYGRAQGSRTYRWIRRDYFAGPASFDRFKVALPKVNGTGALGEILADPVILEPGVGTTYTFITIGSFDTAGEAEACLKYVKSKFARAMLGILKVTQDNKRHTWKHVPKQDFTVASDIDWTKSIPEIDLQLYAKYGLDSEEVAFIESNVKPMV
ncbi:restriction endonuclease [Tessaracoccus lapidicaptus]|uniref:Restriction endonuclease n=1 Tax=Tessaracoccus lapidicaptus TaxID=1427523 RepID=A0A1C0AQR0_9ACTN|nr:MULTISPECIES: Eco57I restriction-modification methylase domain-containing protein [Tessaracoccus]AQX14872.1 restriction endonuclease [Tessaracoccus sp. T2.5-30]OCL36689.1 restriction endonuclease [Tessaracoccus lapidicaptus]VEP39000.1 hypothetical protein TLA_TLA_00445 [Tessaracoccus lapidicaptus]